MSRAVVLLLVAALNAGLVYGMDCSLGQSSNIIDKIINTCPQPFQSSDKSYCCTDLFEERAYCCTFEEFTVKGRLGLNVPLIVIIAVIVALIVCCISCLRCSCCPWNCRRRHGTVYGKVQVPSVVHVIQGSAHVPHASQPQPVAYAASVTGMAQPPPQYTNEMYAQQAPYNPNYVQ